MQGFFASVCWWIVIWFLSNYAANNLNVKSTEMFLQKKPTVFVVCSSVQEFMHYSSVPMQSNHLKHNFAAYLSTHFASVKLTLLGCDTNRLMGRRVSCPNT